MKSMCVALSSVALLAGCGGGSKGNSVPQGAPPLAVRVARVDMKEAGFRTAVVDVVVVVENEGRRPVDIKGAELEATGPLMAPARGAMQPSGAATVQPGGTAYLPVELTLAYPEDPAEFLEFTKAEIAKAKVSGSVRTGAGNVALEDTAEFPTPRLLVGLIKEAQMASLDEGEAGEVTLELVLSNPNPFAVRAEVWDLKLSVAGKDLKAAQLAQGELVQPNAGVGYSEVFKVDKDNWGPDYKTVLKMKKVPYEATGTITVGGVTYPFEAGGSMNFHR